MTTFRAVYLDQFNHPPKWLDLSPEQLPQGEVRIAVQYSSLNYKDALALTHRGKIVRQFPFVPGIDLVGTVIESSNPQFSPGMNVLLTGWGVGERHWGGLSQQARVEGAWLLPLPEGLTPHQAMSLGTAGLTAALAVMRLEEHGLTPANGPVVVTGASGGVGSVAIMLLQRRGWPITAVTGRPDHGPWLQSLGATQIISRDTLLQEKRPLASERWSGAVDVVGGTILATLLSQMSYGSAVTAVGLAQDAALNTTVFPFILRGISLYGVDSVMCPLGRRQRAWALLSHAIPFDQLAASTETISLSQVHETAEALLNGEVRGRVVVDVNA